MEVIAHRAGNDPEAMTAARAVADMVEIDVHLHRGRIDVRHAKRVWGTGRLWERWYLLPPGTTTPTLEQALAWIGPDTPLWVDCKGALGLGLPARVRAAAGARRPATFSGKAWWVLARARQDPAARLVRSAGNRFELLLLRRLPSRVRLDGVTVHQRLLTAPLVAELGQRYGAVYSWAVTDVARARELAGWGVRGLILDSPGLMAAVRSL